MKRIVFDVVVIFVFVLFFGSTSIAQQSTLPPKKTGDNVVRIEVMKEEPQFVRKPLPEKPPEPAPAQSAPKPPGPKGVMGLKIIEPDGSSLPQPPPTK